jgi:hypothetical protein
MRYIDVKLDGTSVQMEPVVIRQYNNLVDTVAVKLKSDMDGLVVEDYNVFIQTDLIRRDKIPLAPCPSSVDIVVEEGYLGYTWPIDSAVTRYKGILRFEVQLEHKTDAAIPIWQSEVCELITVAPNICDNAKLGDDGPAILQEVYQQLQTLGDQAEQAEASATSAAASETNAATSNQNAATHEQAAKGYADAAEQFATAAGDGTIPTELSDMRVGSDGTTTYATAGARVTGEISELNATMMPRKNIFNKSKVIDGSYVSYSSGYVFSNTGFTRSDYIQVSASTAYVVNNYTSLQMAFYDNSKHYISGFYYGNESLTFTTPSTAAYIRFSVQKYMIDDFQIELGIKPTFYEEYQYKIDGDNIGDKTIDLSAPKYIDYYTQFIDTSKATIGKYYDRLSESLQISSDTAYIPKIKIESGKTYYYKGIFNYYCTVINLDGTKFALSDVTSDNGVAGNLTAVKDGYIYITLNVSGGEIIWSPMFCDGFLPDNYIDGHIFNLKIDGQGIDLGPSVRQVTVKTDGKGDYTGIRQAMDAISPDKYNNYIIEVYPGTYDIKSEYSEEEWVDDGSFKGLVVKDFVTIRGIGNKEDIILTAIDTEYKVNISALNLKNTCGLENITVKGEKLRYVIHDDYADAGQGEYKRICKNCIFEGTDLNASYNVVYGSGLKQGANWIFEQCIFSYTDKSNGGTFSTHNNTRWERGAKLCFKNCRFKAGTDGTGGLFILGTLVTGANGLITNIEIIGSKIKTILFNNQEGIGNLFTISGYGNDIENFSYQINDGHTYLDYVDLI